MNFLKIFLILQLASNLLLGIKSDIRSDKPVPDASFGQPAAQDDWSQIKRIASSVGAWFGFTDKQKQKIDELLETKTTNIKSAVVAGVDKFLVDDKSSSEGASAKTNQSHLQSIRSYIKQHKDMPWFISEFDKQFPTQPATEMMEAEQDLMLCKISLKPKIGHEKVVVETASNFLNTDDTEKMIAKFLLSFAERVGARFNKKINLKIDFGDAQSNKDKTSNLSVVAENSDLGIVTYSLFLRLAKPLESFTVQEIIGQVFSQVMFGVLRIARAEWDVLNIPKYSVLRLYQNDEDKQIKESFKNILPSPSQTSSSVKVSRHFGIVAKNRPA